MSGITPPPEYIVQAPMTEEIGYINVKRLLALEVPPTAIICSSMILVLGAHRAIREANLTIGKDISIISHDDGLSSMKTENFLVPLTVTRSPIREAGVELAGMLREIVNGTATGPIQREVPVDLIVRESTAPPPK